MVSRRQFFSGFIKGPQGVPLSEEDREARYQALETHVQTKLLPTRFALTETEQSQLSSRIRAFLGRTSDADLLSTGIITRLKLLVEDVLEPWQMSGDAVTARKKPQELMFAAIESVPLFLKAATQEQIDSLMKRFELINRLDLEVRLREDVAIWIQSMEETELRECDTESIQESAFAHLSELIQGDVHFRIDSRF